MDTLQKEAFLKEVAELVHSGVKNPLNDHDLYKRLQVARCSERDLHEIVALIPKQAIIYDEPIETPKAPQHQFIKEVLYQVFIESWVTLWKSAKPFLKFLKQPKYTETLSYLRLKKVRRGKKKVYQKNISKEE